MQMRVPLSGEVQVGLRSARGRCHAARDTF